MKYRHRILLLSAAVLIGMLLSDVRACGDHYNADHALIYHHSHEHQAYPGSHADHNSTDSETNSPDGEGGNHCHCPRCGGASSSHVGGLPEDILITLIRSSVVWLQKQAFYFAEHLPEEVYLPIWQPPKLAA
jgi:hypothetical protein